jgi:hypothetical protein
VDNQRGGYFRLYGPKEAYFNKTWQLDDVEPAQ